MNGSVNLTLSALNEERQGSGVTNTRETIDAAGQTASLTFPVSPVCQRRSSAITHALSPDPGAEEWIAGCAADL